MPKIAIIGPIHEIGMDFLKKKKFNIFEIAKASAIAGLVALCTSGFDFSKLLKQQVKN